MGEANIEEMNHILVAPTLGSTASRVIAKGFGGPPEKVFSIGRVCHSLLR